MEYVISWKHKTRYGMKGTGTNRYPKHDAEVLAAELNKEFPHIEHWAIPVAESVPNKDRYPHHD